MNRTIHRRKTTGFFLTVFLMLAISVLLTGCGQKTLQIKVIDKQENTFMFVDSSGNEIEYDSLVIGGKEVIDYQCTEMLGLGCVAFATEEGQIVREGGRTTYSGQAYTEAAELLYELKDGVLTITGTK
ncbi:MAG: hypothetical protein ACTTK0_09155 [Stomatobaculum sp.]